MIPPKQDFELTVEMPHISVFELKYLSEEYFIHSFDTSVIFHAIIFYDQSSFTLSNGQRDGTETILLEDISIYSLWLQNQNHDNRYQQK